jgi:hypothetical protein
VTERGGRSPWPWLAALVSILPHLRAAWPDRSYFVRDFTLTYYPLRDAIVAALREGRWPSWNPFVHEGAPFLPMLYPLELVQVLWPGPVFAAWLLTLHFPIAALAAYALARDLGATRRGAFASGVVWSMSGLAVTSLDLHWFLQGLALAPLVVLGLRRAALLGGRWRAAGALLLALAVSTLAVEFVAQAAALGVVLALAEAPSPQRRLAALRVLLALGLGALIAALPLVLTLGILQDSVRGSGLDAALRLQKSLHPLSLAQWVIPDLHGSVREPLRAWWGSRLIPGGSPYFLSLYLGPVALVLAAQGAGGVAVNARRVLLAAAVLGTLYALGPWGGLAPWLSGLVPVFRFPVKAMLLPTLAVAVCAGFGVERVAERSRASTFAAGVIALLAVLVGGGVAWGGPGLAEWLDISPRSEAAMRAMLVPEALACLALASTLVALGALATRGFLRSDVAALLALVLLAADLGAAAYGVNRQVAASFFDPAPGLREAIRPADGGRVFTLGVDQSPFVQDLLARRPPGVEERSFGLARQVLNPYTAILDRVETAEGADRLSFIPSPPLVRPWEIRADAVGALVPRLRNAAVSRLVSLDPLADPALREEAAVPAGIEGATVHVYALENPWPRRYVACRVLPAADRRAAMTLPFTAGYEPGRDVALEAPAAASCSSGRVVERRSGRPEREAYDVTSDGPGLLVVRDSFAAGWRARVDGADAAVLRANGRHRAVAVPAGAHLVELRYEPPGFGPGAFLSVAGLMAAAALMRGRA